MRFSFWISADLAWEEVRAQARHVEATGWDGAYLADHFMPNDDEALDRPVHECFSVLAALAASVPRIRLGSLVASATYRPYGGLGDYMDLGYVPIDREPEAASKTVEYAYDDWTIARMAERLGRSDVQALFDRRAGFWRNTWDPQTRFVRARKADGAFREPFDPTAINYGSDLPLAQGVRFDIG